MRARLFSNRSRRRGAMARTFSRIETCFQLVPRNGNGFQFIQQVALDGAAAADLALEDATHGGVRDDPDTACSIDGYVEVAAALVETELRREEGRGSPLAPWHDDVSWCTTSRPTMQRSTKQRETKRRSDVSSINRPRARRRSFRSDAPRGRARRGVVWRRRRRGRRVRPRRRRSPRRLAPRVIATRPPRADPTRNLRRESPPRTLSSPPRSSRRRRERSRRRRALRRDRGGALAGGDGNDGRRAKKRPAAATTPTRRRSRRRGERRRGRRPRFRRRLRRGGGDRTRRRLARARRRCRRRARSSTPQRRTPRARKTLVAEETRRGIDAARAALLPVVRAALERHVAEAIGTGRGAIGTGTGTGTKTGTGTGTKTGTGTGTRLSAVSRDAEVTAAAFHVRDARTSSRGRFRGRGIRSRRSNARRRDARRCRRHRAVRGRERDAMMKALLPRGDRWPTERRGGDTERRFPHTTRRWRRRARFSSRQARARRRARASVRAPPSMIACDAALDVGREKPRFPGALAVSCLGRQLRLRRRTLCRRPSQSLLDDDASARALALGASAAVVAAARGFAHRNTLRTLSPTTWWSGNLDSLQSGLAASRSRRARMRRKNQAVAKSRLDLAIHAVERAASQNRAAARALARGRRRAPLPPRRRQPEARPA